ncbi:MAG: outer membrane protein assembly factor BamA [Proteobacteria bacterium]|nr:MAG: outer membrane protein assembly factor BamA [Pseudomonadota bacterium]
MDITLVKRWARVCLLFAISSSALAIDAFIVDDIQVKGLNRIAPGTVFNYLTITVGDTIDDQKVRDAVRALFKTGYFRDVRLEREGDILVVIVDERETIADITFDGNKVLKTDNLIEGLGDVGFAKGEVFNEAKLDKVKQELQRQYYAHGKYGVRITSEVTPLDDSSVNVHFTISEGRAARIKEINIVGNEVYSDSQIIGDFELTTPTWTSWFTKDDQYSKQKLQGDLENLRSRYVDNGYIYFNVDSTQVSITPDKADVYITINISEGDRYTISEVKLAGTLIVEPDELFDLVTTRTGMVFSRKKMTQTAKNLTERLGDEGYAFANVNPIPNANAETKTAAITYFIDPGQRVYVRRISFVGNSKTRDEVLRREMRQLEGGWISTSQVERSKVRLQRLGFFEEVNVETPAVPGSTDQVDVKFAVKERPSGNLLLGLGFSQSQGLIFNTNVTQNNFLGSGRSISFAFNNSEVNQLFRLGYLNPYWTIDGVSRGFNLAYQKTDSGNSSNTTQYKSKVMSAGVSFGIPISEYNFVSISGDYEFTDIDTSLNLLDPRIAFFIFTEGNEFDVLRLTSSFSYDTRNSTIFPTRGTLQRIRVEAAVPGGNLRYYKVDYDSRLFLPLINEYVLLLKGRIGYGDSYGQTKELPFFENFYAGGPRTVRGYEENSLGPQDIFGRALGGDTMVVGNAEVIIPVPFLRDFKSVRLTGFFDAGNVFGADESFDLGDLRMAGGLSGVWLSPFGLLSVSIAQPFNDQDGDEVQKFQFTFGTSF